MCRSYPKVAGSIPAEDVKHDGLFFNLNDNVKFLRENSFDKLNNT